jgi:dCTP deaminase
MSGFWTAETMQDRLTGILTPFDPAHVSHSSYELALGDEAFVTHPTSATKTKMSLQVGDRVVIPPGQFSHLLSAERISLPADVLAFISVKFSLKRRGLINVSGFHVDPGFVGKLVFSVYNAGPNDIIITKGTAAFLIWFYELDAPTTHTYGSSTNPGTRQNQEHISDEDVMALRGEVYSPQALASRIQALESRIRLANGLFIATITLIVAPVLVALIVYNFHTIAHAISQLF